MTTCPTPRKRAYSSENQAYRNAATFQERGRKYGEMGEFKAYRCICGKYHLSSVSRTYNPRRSRLRHA